MKKFNYSFEDFIDDMERGTFGVLVIVGCIFGVIFSPIIIPVMLLGRLIKRWE